MKSGDQLSVRLFKANCADLIHIRKRAHVSGIQQRYALREEHCPFHPVSQKTCPALAQERSWHKSFFEPNVRETLPIGSALTPVRVKNAQKPATLGYGQRFDLWWVKSIHWASATNTDWQTKPDAQQSVLAKAFNNSPYPWPGFIFGSWPFTITITRRSVDQINSSPMIQRPEWSRIKLNHPIEIVTFFGFQPPTAKSHSSSMKVEASSWWYTKKLVLFAGVIPASLENGNGESGILGKEWK